MPDEEAEEVRRIFRRYGLTGPQLEPIVESITSDQKRWVDFMMRYELGLEEPDPKRAVRSATTIAVSYVVGGLVPLSPYIAMDRILSALWVSIGLTLVALFCFGYLKGHFTGINPLRGAMQTAVIGGVAAGAAFAIARLIA